MEPLYQRYGAAPADPSKGLSEFTNYTGEGVKGIIAGITKLMETQAERVSTANTLEAQDIFKQRIKNQGLGILAEPIDPTALTRRYGNLIKADEVNKTVAYQTDLLKNAALSNATKTFTDTFTNTKSEGQAGKASLDWLVSNGMPMQQAVDFNTKLRTDNAYLAKDHELAKMETVKNRSSVIIDRIRSGDHTNFEESMIANTDDIKDPAVKDQIIANARKLFEERSDPSRQQKENLVVVDSYVKNNLDTHKAQNAKLVEKEQNILAAMPRVNKSAAAGLAAQIDGKDLGGVAEAISKDATNNAWNGFWRLFVPNDVAGYAAGGAVIENIKRIQKDYGIDPETAIAIGVNAYQGRKAQDSASSPGKGVDPTALAQDMVSAAKQEQAAKTQTAKVLATEALVLKANNEATAKALGITAGYKNKAQIAALKGEHFDILDTFQKSTDINPFAAPADPSVVPTKKPETLAEKALREAGLNPDGTKYVPPARDASGRTTFRVNTPELTGRENLLAAGKKEPPLSLEIGDQAKAITKKMVDRKNIRGQSIIKDLQKDDFSSSLNGYAVAPPTATPQYNENVQLNALQPNQELRGSLKVTDEGGDYFSGRIRQIMHGQPSDIAQNLLAKELVKRLQKQNLIDAAKEAKKKKKK